MQSAGLGLTNRPIRYRHYFLVGLLLRLRDSSDHYTAAALTLFYGLATAASQPAMPASSSSATTSNGPISQKIETAEAVRHADDADTYEMQEGAVKRKWQGTDADRKEMSQLGRVQELRVSRRKIENCLLI